MQALSDFYYSVVLAILQQFKHGCTVWGMADYKLNVAKGN